MYTEIIYSIYTDIQSTILHSHVIAKYQEQTMGATKVRFSLEVAW